MIELEGIRGLEANLTKHLGEVERQSREGLENGGLLLVAKAQKNLREKGINNTGRLSNSGKVQWLDDEEAIEAGFFADSSEEGEGYASAVETGRKAGKMPPPDMLIAWAKKKLRLDDMSARVAGLGIARKIAKKGTQPQPYFQPAIDEFGEKVADEIAKSIKETL